MPKKKLLDENPLFEKTAETSGEKPKAAKHVRKSTYQHVDKSTSKQTNKSKAYTTKGTVRVTYYLPPGMIKDIKRLALEQDKNISEMVREILGEHLNKHTM